MRSEDAGAGVGRLAGPCFVVVLLASVYILFAPSPAGPQGPPGADKVVHLLLFGLLAATARWRFGRPGVVLTTVLGYAALSELVQALFLPHRSGDLRDLVADAAGALLGGALTGRALSGRRGPAR